MPEEKDIRIPKKDDERDLSRKPRVSPERGIPDKYKEAEKKKDNDQNDDGDGGTTLRRKSDDE